MEKRTIYVRQLLDMYLTDQISMYTLAEISQPLENQPLEQKEWISSKILELAQNMTSEEDLIVKVQAASREWLKEISDHG